MTECGSSTESHWWEVRAASGLVVCEDCGVIGRIVVDNDEPTLPDEDEETP